MRTKLIVNIFLLFVTGCGLLPRYEYNEAKSLAPLIREYLLSNIHDLSKEERNFIIETEPEIGHSNYTIYYYWWKNEQGQKLFYVESLPPSNGFKPIAAYRVNSQK